MALTADTKQCSKCNETKNLSEFYKHKGGLFGVKRTCIICDKLKYQEKYKESTISRSKIWKKQNPDKRRLSNRKSQIKTTYGITWETYIELYNKAKGQCQICHTFVELAPSKDKAKFSACVDHNHTTGKVRGLLCRSCNVALGHFYDSKDKLLSAYRYLEENDA